MVRRTTAERQVGDRMEALSTVFGEITELARQKHGTDAIGTGADSEVAVVGLPMPKGAFALRWLLRNDAWPLSRLMQFCGPEGSAKSALLYEVMRWFYEAGGGSVLIETEAKDSPDMRRSIMGRAAVDRFILHRCTSLEDWQEALTGEVEYVKGVLKSQGMGTTVPVLFGIDSLMARASRETITKITEDGFAGRAHPVEALKIASYIRAFYDMVGGYPFDVIGTNHLKNDITSQNPHQKRTPGGSSVKFQETFEIQMQRIGDIDTVHHGGLEVSLQTVKNSLGPSRKKITASLLWRHEVIDGQLTQISWWDWPSATTDLLLKYVEGKGEIAKAVSAVVDLHPKKTTQRVWSNALGISEESPVSYEEAALILDDTPHVVEALHNMFGIYTRPKFQPTMDFQAQVHKAQADVKARTDAGTPVDLADDVEPVDAPGEEVAPPKRGKKVSETI